MRRKIKLSIIALLIILFYVVLIKKDFFLYETHRSPDGKYQLEVYAEKLKFYTKLIPFADEFYFRKCYVKLLDAEGKVLTDTSSFYWFCDYYQYGYIYKSGWDDEENKVWITKFDYIDLDTYRPN